jgi:hypothetical protein
MSQQLQAQQKLEEYKLLMITSYFPKTFARTLGIQKGDFLKCFKYRLEMEPKVRF